jgi:hypothetical protein
MGGDISVSPHQVMKDKVPDELRRESLDDWRMGLLRELKQWLWRQRVKARQERARGERAKASLFSNNG